MEVDDPQYFKEQLYETFKKAGVLDNVKAALRKQLIDNLQGSQEQAEIVPDAQPEHYFYDRKIVSMLVANFLKTHNFNYTYSVLLPETRLSSEEVFEQEELLEAMRVPQSEWRALALPPKVSALEIFLNIFRDKQLKKQRDMHVQTENSDDRPLKDKLENIQNEGLKKIDYFSITSAKGSQQQLLKYKKEIENRYELQLKEEIERFKRYEIAELRMAEAEVFQQKLRKHKKDLDLLYEEKVKRLKEREFTALELCKRRQEDLEKLAHEHRQSHISHIDKLQAAETEFRRHSCTETDLVKEERERIKILERELKTKIREYDSSRLAIQTRIEQDAHSRSYIAKREQELEKDSQMSARARGGASAQEQEELVKQLRENMHFLEQQRQYLSRDCDVLRRDNKDLEHIRSEQTKEIAALKSRLDALQEGSSLVEERANSHKTRAAELERLSQDMQQQCTHLREQLNARTQEHIELHKNFSEVQQIAHEKLVESEKRFMQKIEEVQERHKLDVLEFRRKEKRYEQMLQTMEADNNKLRRDIRALRVQQTQQESSPEELRFAGTTEFE